MKSSLGINESQGRKSMFCFARRPLALAMAVLMAGCSVRPIMEQDFDGAVRTEERQAKPVDFNANSDVDTGYSEAEGFVLRKPEERQSGPLPPSFQKKIQSLTVTGSSVYDALQLIADDAGLSLSIEGGARALERYGSIAMYNLSGTIEKVLDKMSNRIGFYWYVEDGTLVVEQERDFVVDMPPALVDDNMSFIANTFMAFGVKDPMLDHQSRSFSFRANRRVVKMVEEYLEKLHATRSMIAYAINIWQVDLTDGNQKGVDWNKFGATYAKGSVGLVNAAVNSTTKGLGMVFANNSVSVDGILRYLETQGTVKTVSQPRISILSNTKGKIAIGQATTYVSKVGTNVSSALSQVTVETQNLQTGLQMVLFGEVHDNTVYTRVHLSLSDLLKMNKFTALGTDLNLPQTASRELETVTRVKPGDIIVLGGITVNNDTADDTTSFANIVRSRASQRNELVIAIRPVLVNFRGAKQRDAVAPVTLPPLPAASEMKFDDVKPPRAQALAPVAQNDSVVAATHEVAPVVAKSAARKKVEKPSVNQDALEEGVGAKTTGGHQKTTAAFSPVGESVAAVPVEPRVQPTASSINLPKPGDMKSAEPKALVAADVVPDFPPKVAKPRKKVQRSAPEDAAVNAVDPELKPVRGDHGTLDRKLAEPPAMQANEKSVEALPVKPVAATPVPMDLDRLAKENKPSAKGSWQFELDRSGATGKTVVTRGF